MFKRVLQSVILSLLIPITALATNYAVGPSATGNGSGSDYNNLMAWSSSFSRGTGNTYYLIDGAYASKIHQVAVSSDYVITIKKATASDYGGLANWSAGLGDGQAIFNAPQEFLTSYWKFTGSTRNESDWEDGSAYGFRIYYGYYQSANGGIKTRSGYTPANIEVAYTEIEGVVGSDTGRNDLIYNYYAGDNWHVHHSYLHNSNSVWAYHGYQNDNMIWEYNYFDTNATYPAQHGEGFQCIGASGVIVRYNVMENAKGTCMIALNSCPEWEVYGNIFKNNIGFYGNGLIGSGNGDTEKYTASSNLKLYNNTIVNSVCTFSIYDYFSPGWEIRNNIFYGCISGPGFNNASHSYNASDDSISETGYQSITSSVFTNYSENFTLSGTGNVIDNGTDLGSTYDTDMLGVDRGADSGWDIGAYEYDAGGDTTAPTVTGTVIGTDGETVTITFDENVTGTENDTFTLDCVIAGDPIAMTYSSGSTSTSLVFTAGQVIGSTDSCTLDFDGDADDFEDDSGNDLVDFDTDPVTNNSTIAQMIKKIMNFFRRLRG